MAGSKCSWLEQKMIDEALGAVAFTPPATWYVALSTAAFDPTATGTVMNEVTGGSYARVALTNNTTNFPTGAGSNPVAKSIAVAVTFPTATADWGVILSAYLVDAATVGNCGYGADAVSPLVQASGSTLVIGAGTWNFSER